MHKNACKNQKLCTSKSHFQQNILIDGYNKLSLSTLLYIPLIFKSSEPNAMYKGLD